MRNKILGLVILVTLLASFLGAIVPEVPVQANGGGYGENLALGKSITPITNDTARGDPSDVTDGTLNSTWYCYQGGDYNTCEYTLDLGDIYPLGKFEIWPGQSNHVTITISTDNSSWQDCYTSGWEDGTNFSGAVTFSVDGALEARYIHYFAYSYEQRYVGLTEMAIYEWLDTPPPSPPASAYGSTNLALNQTVFDIYGYSSAPENALDGNNDTNWIASNSYGAFRIDLGTSQKIGKIIISPEAIHNCYVVLGNEIGVSEMYPADSPYAVVTYTDLYFSDTTSNEPFTFYFNGNYSARYIWLISSVYGNDTPSINEIEVYGWNDASCFAWGNNDEGQLGTGNNTTSLLPVRVTELTGITNISAKGEFAMALDNNGIIWTWGYNEEGALGNGSTTNSNIPAEVSTSTGLSQAKAISAGEYHVLALDNNGQIWVWGANWSGQLGIGSNIDQHEPTSIYNSDDDIYTSIAAGSMHSLAIREDGTVWAWGDNSQEQIGIGPAATYIYSPSQVHGEGNAGYLTNIQAISGGGYHSLALDQNGQVWAWGSNSNGQLGDGGIVSHSSSPIRVQIDDGEGGWIDFTGVSSISAGNHHSLALMDDGTVFAWGDNDSGQLGIGQSSNQEYAPVQVNGLTAIKAISAGGSHSLALDEDGNVWAWGANWQGQLGNGINQQSDTPIKIGGLTDVTSISAGVNFSLAISNMPAIITTSILHQGYEGSAYSQTLNAQGGDLPYTWSITSGELPPGLELEASTGEIHGNPTDSGDYSFTIDLNEDSSQTFNLNIAGANDNTYAWGDNYYGQLGTGNNTDSLIPIPMTSIDSPLADISASDFNASLALDSENRVWAWGNNNGGQAGISPYVDSIIESPNHISKLDSTAEEMDGQFIQNISAGLQYNLAVDSAGYVWAWGLNQYGTLLRIDSGSEYVWEPLRVKGPGNVGYLDHVIAVSAGYGTSMALKDDGTVWVWGYNTSGQLGNGTQEYNIFYPSRVTDQNDESGYLRNVVAIAIGSDHCLALKADGTVWSWGNNERGQLGTGTSEQQLTPIQVVNATGEGEGFLTDIIAISAGDRYSMALDSSGNVWVWGANYYGVLGVDPDSQSDSYRPSNIEGLNEITAISAGTSYGLALDSEGEVWGWGFNSEGQLGNGTHSNAYTPVQVTDLGNINRIAAGGLHSLAIGFAPDPPTFITTALRPGIIYMDYSQILAAEGGEGDYTWSISSGALPYGMNIDESSGEISGIPEEGGTFNFTVEVSASGSESTRAFTLAVKEPGQPWAFGHNGHEQLGHETANDYSDVPVVVQNLENGAVDVAGGSFSSYAIATNGTVWAWGRNFEGQLGNGSSGNGTDTSTPQQVSDLSGIVAIDGGMFHATALKSDGTVWVWGSNSNGQLGNGETGGLSSTPVQVSDLSDIVAISTGDYFNLALKSDGSVWGWGSNSYYQMGSEGGYTIATPIEPEGLPEDVKEISSGGGHILVLTTDGDIWANGWNDYGQLGNNTTTSSSTPVQVNDVEGLNDIKDITAGSTFSLALTSAGEVWGWGWNRYGMLGFDPGIEDPSGSVSLVPIKVEGLSDIMAISANCYQSLALDSNGIAWSWGSDNWGQLGDGDGGEGIYEVYSFVPDQILNLTDALIVNSAFTHSLVLTNAPLTITTESLAGGKVGKSYSATLEAAGGILPYSWEKISGEFPPGLDWESEIINQSVEHSSTGIIKGTPTAAGTYTFTVRVTDSTLIRDASEFSVQQVEENPDTKTFTITIANASTGGGGGGGGGGSSITLVTNGCGAPSPIKLNSSGYALSAAQITTPDGNVILGLKYWTHMMASAASVLIHMDVSPLTAPPAAPAGRAFVYAYSFGPEGATFNPALTITMKYNPATLPANIIEKSLYIAYFDGTSWQKLDSTVDTANKTVTAQITHFSNYALMGEVTAPATTVAPSPTAAETPTVKPSPSPTSKPSATPTASATASPIVTAAPTTPVYSPATTEIPTTTSRTEPTPANNWLIWVIIVVIVALLTAIVFIWRRRSTHS